MDVGPARWWTGCRRSAQQLSHLHGPWQLLQLLASSRPFHLLSDAFHSAFDRTVRYKAALALLTCSATPPLRIRPHRPVQSRTRPPTLLHDDEYHTAHPHTHRAVEEKKEDDADIPSPSTPHSTTPSAYPSPSPSPSSLLSLSAVLRPPQRLAALFLLYDFPRPDLSPPPDALLTATQAQSMLLHNPFLPHLLHHLDSLDGPPPYLTAERQLLVRLLLHLQMASIRQRSTKDFIDAYKPDRFSTQPSSAGRGGGKGESGPTSELAAMLQPLRRYVQARLPPPAPSLTSYLALVEVEGSQLRSSPTTPVSGRSGASISPASFADDPRSTSPPPSTSSSSSTSSTSAPLPFDVLLECMQRAQRIHLSSNERHAVIDALTSSPALTDALLQHGGLGPQHLPLIIEKNPTVAVAFLHSILSPPLATPALSSLMLSPLLQLDLSLHSMEVVNRLATSSSPSSSSSSPSSSSPTPSSPSPSGPSLLPPDFLSLYLHHALECCRALRDKYAQSRMVRLVCVFLQSLLRGERRDGLGEGLDGLREELMSFCVDFSKVKEAAALFRLLKEWEAETG